MSSLETITIGNNQYNLATITNLSDLEDVEITDLQDGDFLAWNLIKQKFVNKNLGNLDAWELVAHNAQISTGSAYMTSPTLLNPFEYKVLFVNLKYNQDDAFNYLALVNVNQSATSQNFSISAHTSINCTITTTTVGSYQYSGSYRNMWVDIWGIKSPEY